VTQQIDNVSFIAEPHTAPYTATPRGQKLLFLLRGAA
jgi:hypothetical protein